MRGLDDKICGWLREVGRLCWSGSASFPCICSLPSRDNSDRGLRKSKVDRHKPGQEWQASLIWPGLIRMVWGMACVHTTSLLQRDTPPGCSTLGLTALIELALVSLFFLCRPQIPSMEIQHGEDAWLLRLVGAGSISA